MHLTAPEEFGLRCMLQLARSAEGEALTLPEIAEREGMSVANAGKIMAILKRAGLVRSARGRQGGYRLARPAGEVSVSSILGALGGDLFGDEFCTRYRGEGDCCVHGTDCSLRSMWAILDDVIRRVLDRLTLKDLLCSEPSMATRLRREVGEPVRFVSSIVGAREEV